MTVAESRRYLGAGAALSVAVQGGAVLANAALSIVLARIIGPSGNGRYALVYEGAALVGLVASLGLSAGIVYEVSRRRWSVRSAFRTSYAVGAALGLAGMCVGAGLFALTRDTVYHGIPFWLAAVALATLPPGLAYQNADSILLARERYEDYARLELSRWATVLLIGSGLAIPFGVTGAVVGLPASALVAAAVGVFLLTREMHRDTVADLGGSLRRALPFGLQSLGANLLQQINYRFDVLILGAFASAGDVGVYAVALTVSSLSWILPQALQTVLFPRVASLDEATLAGEMSVEESDLELAKAVRHGVLLTLPAAFVISFLLLVGVPLVYGAKFHDTTWLGFVLLPGTLMLGIGRLLSSATTGRGYPRYALYNGLISVPLTLALYFGLIPPFQAWGAAIGSSVSYGLTAVVALFFFRRVTGIGLREAFVPRSEDIADYREFARLALAKRRHR